MACGQVSLPELVDPPQKALGGLLSSVNVHQTTYYSCQGVDDRLSAREVDFGPMTPYACSSSQEYAAQP